MPSSSERGEKPIASGSRAVGPERTVANSARSREWDARRTLGFELPEAPASSLPPIGQSRKRRFAPKAPVVQKAPVSEAARPLPAVSSGLAETDDFGGLSVKFAIIFLFLRFSFLHEFLTVKFGAHLYLIVIVGAVAYLSLLKAATWRAVTDSKLYRSWLIFSVLLAIGVPFSLWPGGSYGIVLPFIKDNFLCIPLIGGLFGTWARMRRLLIALGWAGVIVVLLSTIRNYDVGGRLAVDFTGSVGNPNDIAAHIIFVIPFMLFAGFSQHTKILFKLVLLGSIPICLYVMLRTGSRGAFIGLAAGLLFTVVTGSSKVKLTFVAVVPVLAIAIFALLPRADFDRLFTFSNDATANHEEAVASYEARQNLLKNSISATLHNPIFGVGAGQFGSYEGNLAIAEGHPHNNWQETHNSFTEISSENGIPALCCMVYAIVGTFLLFFRVYKQAREHPQLNDLATAAFLLATGMISFCVSAFFLNFGYKVYFVVLTGLAIALQRCLLSASVAATTPVAFANSRLTRAS